MSALHPRARCCALLLALTGLLDAGLPAQEQRNGPREETAPPSDETESADGAERPTAPAERVTVTAGGQLKPPLGTSTTRLTPADDGAAPATLTEVVSATPGVSQNGQGGLFQVFSIRGVSRQRVLSQVSGARITSERRAGTSTSFVDPLLMDDVEVIRGPSTTLYGGNALGGAVQVVPRRFSDWSAAAGYDSNGDERYLVGGSGGRGWSVGVARRQAGNGEAADGSELNSHFEQTSAVLRIDREAAGRRYELLFVPSLGRDIGKVNSDFPARTTNYPRERHGLLELRLTGARGWRFNGFVHAHDLETEVTDALARSTVFNDTVDFGLRWDDERELMSGVALAFGVDAFGRHGVEAEERTVTLDPLNPAPPSVTRTLDDGREIEASTFAVARWDALGTGWESGARFSRLEQDNRGDAGVERTSWSGFVGFSRPFGTRWTLDGNLSLGVRFPTLTELFFTGTTGRGQVIGNPALEEERARSGELTVRWQAGRVAVYGTVFNNRVTDYIERVDIQNDLRTFVNLTSGTIRGVELQGLLSLPSGWSFGWGGHAMDGEASDGRPLADVPPDETWFELRGREGRFGYEGRLALRAAKRDPGSGESGIPSAQLVEVALRFEPRTGLELALRARNLLDETWFASADDKALPAPRRSIGLQLAWRPAR